VRGILTCSLVGLHGRPERGWGPRWIIVDVK